MKGSNIVSGIHSLKMAQEFFLDFTREFPDSSGSKLFDKYNKRIDWILNDLITHTSLPEDVREGIKEELKSDVFTVPAILEKVSLLRPEQRETIETLIDAALNGEEFRIVD